MINITSKLLEEKVYKFFGIKTIYAGKLVNECLKLIKPVKYAFFSINDKESCLKTFDEKLLLEIIKKR